MNLDILGCTFEHTPTESSQKIIQTKMEDGI